MLLIPYRAKNPPERFPYVTLSLIAINTLLFALTSHLFLEIHEGVVRDYALSHETMSVLRLFTAMFLHGSLLHLLGNMLFLWIFGSSVEGRLGPLKFIGVYLAAGLVGFILEDLLTGIINPKLPILGASGAIMGLAGAYLYMFPFAAISVVWGWGLRLRLMEWQAQWVVLYFVVFDILNGLISKSGLADGVAHFAHLGGAGAGFFGVILLRAKRDSEDYSNAQAVRATAHGDYHVMALHELETLMENPQDNVALVMTFCRKAAKQVDGSGYRLCLDVLQRHARLLIEQADPEELGRFVLALPDHASTLPAPFYLRLGGRLESVGSYELAARTYRRIYEMNPNAPDTEMALLRLGRLTEQTAGDKAQAASIYTEMLRLFPNGPLAMQARDALRRLPTSNLVFSAGNTRPAEGTAPVGRTAPPGGRPAPIGTSSTNDTAPIQGTAGRAAPPVDPLRNATPAHDDLAPVGGVPAADDDLRPLGG